MIEKDRVRVTEYVGVKFEGTREGGPTPSATPRSPGRPGVKFGAPPGRRLEEHLP